SNEKQHELDFYLKEPKAATTSSICVLDFWKSQQYRYPILAKMAMDILCVPVSTVLSKSAFSVGGRILDKYRSSMKPPTLEALICTRDWLFSEKVVTHANLEEECWKLEKNSEILVLCGILSILLRTL
ncbi:zinc finger BED domain-containing protein RICESLEEPER 2-like protein, partial [Tanacetum coccineum]